MPAKYPLQQHSTIQSVTSLTATVLLGDALMGLLDLFKPKWRHSKAEIRLKAVDMIENQPLLTRIATEDKDGLVRTASHLDGNRDRNRESPLIPSAWAAFTEKIL